MIVFYTRYIDHGNTRQIQITNVERHVLQCMSSLIFLACYDKNTPNLSTTCTEKVIKRYTLRLKYVSKCFSFVGLFLFYKLYLTHMKVGWFHQGYHSM